MGELDHRYRGEHPLRTLAYLYRDHRRSLLIAVVAFVFKHSPTWMLPLVTANIIDVLVDEGPVSGIWLNAGVLCLLLTLNYPFHLLYVRHLSGTIRKVSTGLRSSLCARMQQLSIGYHARVSAGVLQTKVIRDVESVETMSQQAGDIGLSALVMLAGGVTVIAIKVPQALPVFLVVVPAAAILVMRMRDRHAHRQRELPPGGRAAVVPGDRDDAPDPDHPRPRPGEGRPAPRSTAPCATCCAPGCGSTSSTAGSARSPGSC